LNKFFRNVSFYLLIIIIAISIIDYYSSRTTTKQEVSYTQFLHQIEEQKVERVTIVDNTIKGKLKDGTEFTTITPNDPTLIATLRE
jgi:cell division protease FtsH